MRIEITKYHGLGNDFVVTHYKNVKELDLSKLAISVCDRHTSVGADGLIVVKENPLEMIYYNSDGSRAKMCGNGIRCFTQYIADENILKSNTALVKTLAGDLTVNVISKDPFMVSVDMGKASFQTKDIPMDIDSETYINQQLTIDDETYHLTSLSMNVTHTTLETTDFNPKEMERIGRKIQNHKIFPNSTNVNFYNILSDNKITMQTYERGAGLTLACGTGACAVYSALHKNNQISGKVEMILPKGSLFIDIDENNHIIMTGPSEKIISGVIDISSATDHRGENNV